jgi:hypothetical protein
LVKWFSIKVHNDNNHFTDIGGETKGFRDDINWMYQYAITTGVTWDIYAPRSLVTRAQMAAFLQRLAGSPVYKKASCGFTDVTGNYTQFSMPICWLKSTGVTTGVDSTHYQPEGLVTRAQMAAFIHRLAGASVYNQTSCGFVDIGSMPDGFKKDICWLRSTGITTGVDSSHFAPNAPVMRVQMAAFMHRLYNWSVR